MTAAYGLASDMGTVTEKTRAQREIRREIDKAASDDLMQYISRDFEVKLSKFNRVLDSQSKAFWSRSTEEIRDLLAGIVSGSDTLTDERRKELERIIITYKPISFDEKSSEQLFNKDEFERRFRIMNITIWQSNHLDIVKLVNAYNSNMEQSVMSLYQSVADSHRESADNWIRSLLDEIYENIVAYSPELSKQARLIENMTVQINGLVERQEQLKKYTKQLDAMMDWTEI